MKLTWFGGTTLRVYLGGEIVVLDPPVSDNAEIVSGAARLLRLEETGLEPVDPARARRRVRREIDAGETDAVAVGRLSPGALLLEAEGEPPLAVLAHTPPAPGRWADGAVLVVIAAEMVAPVAQVLAVTRPRLVALALDAPDAGFMALSDRLDGAGLVVLERGLALEA